MKKILITGVAGLLGSNLSYLLRNEYDICGVDRNPFSIQGVRFVKQSLSDSAAVNNLFIGFRPDCVIHCAAMTNLDQCEKDPEAARTNNVLITENLADQCEHYHAKLIFISTDAVFDGTKAGLYSEKDRPDPVSIYGKNKLEAESIVLQGKNNLVARTNFYGYNYRNKNSFGEWVLNSLTNEETLNMFDDVHFSPVLVNELCHLLDMCMKHNLAGLYHICGTGSVTKYELGMLIMKRFGLNGRINRTSIHSSELYAPRTENMSLDNSKIKDALGIDISTPYQSVDMFRKLYDAGYPIQLKSGR